MSRDDRFRAFGGLGALAALLLAGCADFGGVTLSGPGQNNTNGGDPGYGAALPGYEGRATGLSNLFGTGGWGDSGGWGGFGGWQARNQ